MPMNTMLVTKRRALVRQEAVVAAAPRGPGQSPMPVAGDDELGDDLGRGQVAHQALRARVAERAGERAADLARNAQSAAIDLGDVDALDLRALVVRAGRGPCGSAICGCRPSTPARTRPPAGRAYRLRRAPRAGPCPHWSSRRSGWRRADRSSARAARRASCCSRSGTPMRASLSFSSSRVRPTRESRLRPVSAATVRSAIFSMPATRAASDTASGAALELCLAMSSAVAMGITPSKCRGKVCRGSSPPYNRIATKT